MQRALVIVGLGLGLALGLVACGPAVEPPVDDGGGSQGTESGTTGSGASETDPSAEGTTDAGEATTAPPGTSEGSADASSSGGLEELAPPESVITTVTCNDDGTLALLIEVILEGVVESCAPPADIEADDVLLVSIPVWDGVAGTYEVGPGAPAHAVLGTETLEGTLTLEAHTFTHPSMVTLDLGEGLVGGLVLEACGSNDAPCDGG